MDESDFYGRLVPVRHDQIPALPEGSMTIPAIKDGICQRCATKINTTWSTPTSTYCWACANLGRLSDDQFLATIPEPNVFETDAMPCQWQGELTPAQRQVADEQVQALKAGRSHLTYAVTGAGKTEMLFPMLTAALQAGKRIALVSPRVDVIVELAPRLREAFKTDFVVLYGDSPETYRYTQLVLASTHQLLRFRAAFDVIVVDEVDAFPYAENVQLEGAVQRATKPQGCHFYLTATPSTRLLRDVSKQRLRISLLPRRYHGQPLPNFTIIKIGNWRKKLSWRIQRILREYVRSKQRFLIFVPHVADLTATLNEITRLQPSLKIAATHAGDPDRQGKVQAMRASELQALITTTILERGVTFKGIDVMILGADDPVFSQAALIQIAGRCGRSAARPTGKVWTGVTERTRTVVQARNEIRYLNMKGKQYDV